MPTLTVTRDTIDLIRACATGPGPGDSPATRTERPATRALAYAGVAAEREPFQILLTDLADCFGGDIDAALAEDEPAALAEVARIVGEHLDAARTRLTWPTPIIDWTDHVAITQALPAIARRAGDLHFVSVFDRHAQHLANRADA